MTTTIRYVLRHRVAVRHGGSGRPFAGVLAELVEPVWPHWVLRRRDANVLLATYGEHLDREPATTRLRIAVADPATATRFKGDGVVEVDVGRDTPVVDLALTPVDVRVEVTLVRPNRTPVGGRIVELRASDGSTVALHEVAAAGPGVHRSARRQWGPAFQGAQVLVGGEADGRHLTPDYSTDMTRVRVIVPA